MAKYALDVMDVSVDPGKEVGMVKTSGVSKVAGDDPALMMSIGEYLSFDSISGSFSNALFATFWFNGSFMSNDWFTKF